MKVRIRYFASLREALGPEDELDLNEGSTLASLRDLLVARGGPHAEVLDRARAVRVALNQALVPEDVVITPGAEVAFFPPVTGG